jgi:uncharacterized protein (TIGR00159 family)
MNFINENLISIIDIFSVIIIIFLLYRWLRGTSATWVIFALVVIYIAWKVVSLYHLEILTYIFGQVIQVGLISVVVIFQPEIRKFLFKLGSRKFIKWVTRTNHFVNLEDDIEAVVSACKQLASSRTGALIIMEKTDVLNEMVASGEQIDALVSRELLKNIFYKNNPLHDGAVIIRKHRIVAARCILPVSKAENLPTDVGLRHRSAVGVSTETDAIAIVVSEQTGQIAVSLHGNLHRNIPPTILRQVLFGKAQL